LAIIATEWDQIKHCPLEFYTERMESPVIIDGSNCYSLRDIISHPISYISIVRPSITLEKVKEPNSCWYQMKEIGIMKMVFYETIAEYFKL